MSERKKRRTKQPTAPLPLIIHSLTLTEADKEIVERLSSDASDYIGRRVSGSAVLRALVRFADRQGYRWVLSDLCPFIEREMSEGVLWGKQR